MASSGRQFAIPDARRLCRALLDAINDVILIFDPGTAQVIDANRSAARIYGYTKKELIGTDLQKLSRDPIDYSHALRSEAH